MGSEFKEFIMKGDVLDLAVGVVIGGAFTAIVNNIVESFITPLIALVISFIPGVKDGDLESALGVLEVKINGVVFNFGGIISAIITFLLTGFVLFILVRYANRVKKLHEKPVEEDTTPPAPTTEDYLAEIRDLLREQQK